MSNPYPHSLTRAEFEAVREPLDEHYAGDQPYPPDWQLSACETTGDTEYPYRVTGINLNCKPGEYGHEFSWRVPDIDWRYFAGPEFSF